MKSQAIFLSVACAVAILMTDATAQDAFAPQEKESTFGVPGVTGTVPMSPEMWLYLHEEQREEDPQVIVRRKAQEKSVARRNRIAAMRWFGFSASRPRANPTPWTGQYSPVWVGNGSIPSQWRGTGGFQVAQPIPSTVRR
jgi:hypothetical protein